MPIYEPDHVEYTINSSHIQIVLDNAVQMPAYLAHPTFGLKFPGVVLIHDWWGITPMIRRLANLYAQMGYYVIVPDLFDGRTTASPKEAMRMVEGLGKDSGFTKINEALEVLEHHHHTNRYVAAVGVGMGGSLAFEAAITRTDLEAAVAYGGFPNRYFGRFANAPTPICAYFGANEPHIKREDINRLREELSGSDLSHVVNIVPDIEHEFFSDTLTPTQRERSRQVMKDTLDFLDGLLIKPKKPTNKPM